MVLVSLLIAFIQPVNGQKKQLVPDFEYVLNDIITRLDKGQQLAIRDLANIWEKQPQDQGFKALAERYLLLTKEEFDWAAPNLPQQLLHFYYDKEDVLQFSEFLNVFYLTPIEDRKVMVNLKNWQSLKGDRLINNTIKENIDYALKRKRYSILKEAMLNIDQFEPAAVEEIVIDLLGDNRLYKIKPKAQQQRLISESLSHLPDSTAVRAVFRLFKQKKIDKEYCQLALAEITNHSIPFEDRNRLREKWEELLGQYQGNFASLKKAGYSKVHPAQSIFFEEEVDYYAWMMVRTSADTAAWIHNNALDAMLATKSPKVLFYLAGLQFRAWKKGKTAPYLKQLERLIDVRIWVKDRNDKLVYEYLDPVAQLNFLIYWSKNYSDYEWEDTEQGIYTNMVIKNVIVESYERFFRRLNSANDTAAYEAFYTLTEGLPSEVARLMKKYRRLLRTYNEQLPPLKFNILENISSFTHFCKLEDFPYKPPPPLKQLLLQLEEKLSPIERYKMENQMIATLQLEELSYLEYWAATRAHKSDLNVSVGRILDRLYAKYWTQLVDDRRQFRLFLLKSVVFKRLTNFGIARLYHKKLSTYDEKVRKQLIDIALLEQHPLIKEAIDFWKSEEQETKTLININVLLANPEAFELAKIPMLSPLSAKLALEYFATLKRLKSRQSLKVMERYLIANASTDIVPALFRIPKSDWQSNTAAAKIMVKGLEAIYGYSFSKKTDASIEGWYTLWETQSATYQDWDRYLFDLQLEELATKETIRINNINTITQSKFYQPIHRAICLESLQKIEKTRSLSQLRIEPLISVKHELSAIEMLSFSYRELDNLTKVLDINDPQLLLQFLVDQSKDFNIDQKGFLFNNLLRQDWLFQLVGNQQVTDSLKGIFIQYLEGYLNESDYLTEFEEQTTQLNILFLKNSHLAMTEKLQILNDPLLEYKVKLKWLHIIFARITFEEIPQIFAALDALEEFDPTTIVELISKDFGLPLYDINEEQISIFEQRLGTQSERAIYEQYLTDFGINFTTKNGKLDFQKIYGILQYDLVIPFVGEGGQYRDYYVYALIKVLELHFETTLGFSPKLNEYQTFFQFNSFGRAEAWRKYLLRRQFVKQTDFIPSFNESAEL